jgi:hypothetical protein
MVMLLFSWNHQSIGLLILSCLFICSSSTSSEKSIASIPYITSYSSRQSSASHGNGDTHLLASSANLLPSVLSALHDFYNSTHGDSWDYVNVSSVSQVWNWTQPNPNPCSQKWQGITRPIPCSSLFFYCVSVSCFLFPFFSLPFLSLVAAVLIFDIIDKVLAVLVHLLHVF